MKLGKDFWFWLKILFQIIKSILDSSPATKENPTTPGERMFKTVVGRIVEDNEDDKHNAIDVTAL